MKKIIALIFSLVFVFVFSACNKTGENSTPEEKTTHSIESEAESVSRSEAESLAGNVTVDDSYQSDDPTSWSVEEIVDFYKKAAANSHSKTKSQHKIDLKKISVNNG